MVIEPALLTLSLMTLSLLGAVPLGVLWGWSIVRLESAGVPGSSLRNRGGAWSGRLFRLLGRACGIAALMMLALPIYVHAAGWEGTAGKFGWMPMVASGGRTWFHGLLATAWIHASHGACWVAIATVVGMRGIVPSIRDAGRMDAGPLANDFWLRLPLAVPWIAAAAAWVALVTVTEMTVADLYAVRTLADTVYVYYALDPEPLPVLASVLLPAAAVAPLVLWVVAASGRFQWTMRGSGSARLGSRGGSDELAAYESGADAPGQWGPLGWSRAAWAIVATGITALVVGVPALSLVLKAGWTVTTGEGGRATGHQFTLERMITTIVDAWGTFAVEALWSIQLAVFAALVWVPVGWMLARLSRRRRTSGGAITLAMVMLVMVPGPVVSLAVIELFHRPSLMLIYDQTLVPTILALAPRAVPAAYLILRGGYRMLDSHVDDLAAIDGCGWFVRVFRVEAPRLRRSLGFAVLAVALVALADLSATLLVLPPGVSTMASRLFGLLHSGVRHQEAGLALMAAIGSAAVTLAGLRWLRL